MTILVHLGTDSNTPASGLGAWEPGTCSTSGGVLEPGRLGLLPSLLCSCRPAPQGPGCLNQ